MRFVTSLRERVRRLVAGAEEGAAPVAAAPVVLVREVFRRFWPLARPYRRWLPLILFLVALGPAIEAATIWMYKVLVDEVLVPRQFAVEEHPLAHRLPPARGMVEFDSVSFRHPGSPRPALEDLSFRVSPGETLAFVGPSGASANQPAATKFAMGLELHCKHFSRSALQHFSLSLAEVLTS